MVEGRVSASPKDWISIRIYPLVEVFTLRAQKDDFYLTASRRMPYKKIPRVVEAFSATADQRLVVVGDGPDFEHCKALERPNSGKRTRLKRPVSGVIMRPS